MNDLPTGPAPKYHTEFRVSHPLLQSGRPILCPLHGLECEQVTSTMAGYTAWECHVCTKQRTLAAANTEA